ncbi:MAG: hypothetical protein MUC84_07600 [Solirubrobacteraceae bacterium]|nr:hypothetical protein [Solirubrobacteraceae bacterium]
MRTVNSRSAPLAGALSAVVFALAVAAAPASATTRYAGPGGTGSAPCTTLPDPCALPDALAAAEAGDEVVALAGAHVVSSLVSLWVPITLRGEGAATIAVEAAGGISLRAGGTIRDLAVEVPAAPMALALNGPVLVERVRITAGGLAQAPLQISNSTAPIIRDSVVRALGAGAVAVLLYHVLDARLVNLTATGSGVGSSEGIRATSAPAPCTLTVRNTIIRGFATDLRLQGAASAVDVDWSSYATTSAEGTLTAGTHNQTGTLVPLFANAAAGDLRQAPGSPTIDAGTATAPGLGTTDLDGDPRIAGLGLVPDIGADEYVPGPSARTLGASAVTPTSATVTGAVAPRLVAGNWWFEYGPTAAYGSSTAPQPVGAGEAGDVAVSAALTGLPPATAIHYRVVAETPKGRSAGDDATFTTLAAPQPPAPPAAPPQLTLSGLRATPSTFRLGRRLPAMALTPVGTRIGLRLSAPAAVTLTFLRRADGRRSGGRCVAPTARLRRAPRCTRLVRAGALSYPALTAGGHTLRFQGRLTRARQLSPGRYTLRATARDAGGRTAAPVETGLRILP